jgi:hypothetical protein
MFNTIYELPSWFLYAAVGLIAVVAIGVVRLTGAASQTAVPQSMDLRLGQLKVLPRSIVAQAITIGPRTTLTVDSRDTFLAALARLSADHQRLIYLTELLSGFRKFGLHTFFFMDDKSIAPHMHAALRESGLMREAVIFQRALSLFGADYGVDFKRRYAMFAWSQEGTRIDDVTTMPASLNAFDEKLMALADDFGSQEVMSATLERVLEQDPGLSTLLNDKSADVTDDDRLRFLGWGLVAQLDMWVSADKIVAQLQELPVAYRHLAALWMFETEMLNGSVHQFFYNSTGGAAPEVVEALRSVGLPAHADAVQRGIDMFPKSYERETTARRAKHFDSGEWSEFDQALGDLTDQVDDGRIHEAMIELARRTEIMPK